MCTAAAFQTKDFYFGRTLDYECSYGECVTIADGLRVRFSDIGHLLGSACIEFWLREGGTEK